MDQLSLRMALTSLSIVIAVSSIQIAHWNLQNDFAFIVFFDYLSNFMRGRRDYYQGVFRCLSCP